MTAGTPFYCSHRRIDDDKGKTHELAQSAVKCMRGILACWLRQADKVEKFKRNQSFKNALHSKFHLITGDPVTKDEEYEHLQVISFPQGPKNVAGCDSACCQSCRDVPPQVTYAAVDDLCCR